MFLFCTSSRPVLGSTQTLIQWVPGGLSSGVKRPGREADHSRPSGAKVKNGGAMGEWMYRWTFVLPRH
jgi:hypothetical protein